MPSATTYERPDRSVDDALRAAQLAAVASTRDKQAFADLFDYYAPRVLGFLTRTGLPATIAEDCMQDVMVTLWHKAGQYDPTRASVTTWVFTIARNRKIDTIRKLRRPEPLDLPWGPEATEPADETLSKWQDRGRLVRAIAALPAKQREMIEQAFYGDHSHGEIAARTGLPLGTIKSRIRLAIDRLRHSLQTDGGIEGGIDGAMTRGDRR